MRLPDGMKDTLQAAAKENNRTLTAEIVFRLAFTIDLDLKPDGDGVSTVGYPVTVEQRIDNIELSIKNIEALLRGKPNTKRVRI